jgi:uncharacterized alpha/beta hydrolase family protein
MESANFLIFITFSFYPAKKSCCRNRLSKYVTILKESHEVGGLAKLFLNKRSALFAIGSVFIILIAAVITIVYNKSHQPIVKKSDTIPTVFVHGFKGSARSFNNMLGRFENNYHWGKREMVFNISKTGQVQVWGNLPKYQIHPFIQVIFQDSHATIHNNTIWLKDVMGMLHQHYHVKRVNLVGHSMGGLDSTNFIEQTHNQRELYPSVVKLITIGSPFAGIDRKSYYTNKHNYGPAVRDLKPNSTALQSLFIHRKWFDPTIKVLSIAGLAFNPKLGDGVVPLNSALGSRYIVPPQNFETRIVNDINATHSQLHENEMVDRFIGEFLWGIGEDRDQKKID